MAFDGSVNIDSKIDGSGFTSGLQKLNGAARKVLGTLSETVVGIGAALGGAAVAGVKYNSQMEQYVASFGTMLGGADKAQSMIVNLKKYAAETPFEFTDLAKGTQTLLSFGVSASDVMPDLKMLGDVSQGNTDKFNTLSLAFAQTSSSGKLMGQDLLQYVSAGFNPLNELSKMTGKSMSELRDEMSKGQISAQDVADAFKHATSEGGQFYGAMTAQSKTFSGQLSTLKDNTSQFLGDLTAGLQNSLKNTALPMVNGWMTELQSAFQSGGISGVVSTLGTVLSQAFTAVAQQAPGIINMAVSLIQSFLLGIQQNLPQITAAASQIITSLAEGIGTVLPQLILTAADIITALANDLAANPQPIADAAVKIIDALVRGIIQAAPALANAAVSIASTFFSELAKQSPAEVPLVGAVLAALSVEKFKGPVSGIIKEIKKIPGAFDNTKTGISNFAKFAGDKFDTVRIVAMEAGDKFKEFGPKISGALSSAGSTIGGFAKTVGSGLLNGIKTIGSGIGTLAQTIGTTLWSGLQKIGAFIAANPIVLVIAAIAVLVAIIIHLWQTNEGFRNAVIGIWTAIVGFFSTVGTAIAGFFTAAWNIIKNLFLKYAPQGLIISHWSQITAFFQNLWAGVVAIFSAAWAGIQGIWNGVTGFFSGVWRGIQSVFSAVGSWFSSVFGAAWSGVQSIWSAATGFFSGVWNGITRIFSVVGGWFKNVFSTAWNGVKNVWSAATGWFQGIWNGITKVFSVVGSWFSSTFTTAWNGIKTAWAGVTGFFSGVWSGITGAFNNVSGWFSSTFGAAYSAITTAFSGLKSFFSGVWEGITGAFRTAINFIIKGVNTLIRGLNHIHFDFPDWVPGVGGKGFGINIGEIPLLAKGGVIDKATLAMLGEHGKEAVVPLERDTGWIRSLSKELISEVLNQQRRAGEFSKIGTSYFTPALATAGAPTYNQTVNNYSPKALSPAESARLTRNSTRQLLLSVKKR